MTINTLAGTMDWSRARAIKALLLVMAGAFLLRVAYAVWSFCSTFDTATVGLMALNILNNGERPLFFYGQNYFGSIEAYTAAFLFNMFGPSEVALSMAPILFTLGWLVASYLLFAEWSGRKAGLIGALVVAFPSFVILRYSAGTDGGYPTAFMLGTLALWLCLRMEGRNVFGRALLVPSLLLGGIAGLALWTHALSAAYLLPGAILIFVHLYRHRFRWTVLGPLLLGSLPFVACILPVFTTMSFSGDGSAGVNIALAPETLWNHFSGMFRRPLRQHMYSQWESDGIKVTMRVLLILTAGLYLTRGRELKCSSNRVRYVFPLIFGILFTVLYVMNPMARVLAPRYTIPLWVIFLGGLLAGPMASHRSWVRRVAVVVACGWSLFYLFSCVHYIVDTADRRQNQMAERNSVVASARAAGVSSATIVGPSLVGHQGQIYSFTSGGELAFVNAYDERHRPSAEFNEHDGRAGFLIQQGARRLFAQSLKDLGATWSTKDAHGQTLYYDVNATPLNGRILPVTEVIEMQTPGTPAAVSDRLKETTRAGTYGDGQTIAIQLAQTSRIDAILMMPVVTTNGVYMPRKLQIEGSLDGEHFFALRSPLDRVSVVYTAGNRVWTHGYFTYAEYRFPAADVRYLRLTPMANERADDRKWGVSEVLVHEAGAPGRIVTEDELLRIEEYKRAQGIRFVMADRWLSARLNERMGPGVALPRYNPKFADTRVDRTIVPSPGLALAVQQPFVDDSRILLRAAFPDADLIQEEKTGYYTIFRFTRHASRSGEYKLTWYGSSIMRAFDNAAGIPVK